MCKYSMDESVDRSQLRYAIIPCHVFPCIHVCRLESPRSNANKPQSQKKNYRCGSKMWFWYQYIEIVSIRNPTLPLDTLIIFVIRYHHCLLQGTHFLNISMSSEGTQTNPSQYAGCCGVPWNGYEWSLHWKRLEAGDCKGCGLSRLETTESVKHGKNGRW